MVFSESSEKPHFLKPCITSIDESESVLRKNRPASSPPDLEALSSSVSFHGWRFANANFKSWARKMAALHEPTWRKAGIFEAIMASTFRIHKNTDLVLGIAEKWCPDTKSFIFSWGETTITLEDVMVLLGFSVLGLPVFATLDSSDKKKKNIQRNLKKEWVNIKNDKGNFVTLVEWMKRFVDCGGELEHAAFLTLWLSYFVFPSCYYHISDAIFPIAVHLSSGTRIALAPAVLAHLYADLTLLKTHIRDFTKSPVKIELGSLFKLVQLWTWERFKELQPKPNPILKVEPRLTRWYDLKQRTTDVRQILENSKMDSVEWRPYTIAMSNWIFPKFYPEKAMQIPVGPDLDDEFISFARFIKVSELVGMNCVEHYFPNRVASQFGLLQNVPDSVNRNSLSQEAAWNDYNKPIEDLTLYIPSRFATARVTPFFCEWWRKTFPKLHYLSNEKQVKSRNLIGDDTNTNFVPYGSKVNRTCEDKMKIAESLKNKKRKYMKQARDKRREYMKRGRKSSVSTMGQCQTQVPSDNDDEDDNLTIAQALRLKKKKYSEVPLGNNDSGHCQKLALINKRRNHMKQLCEKRCKYMKQARENESSMGCCQKQIDDDDDSLVNAQMRLDKKCGDVKKSGGDDSGFKMYKRRKYMKRGCEYSESTIGRCQKQVPSNNDDEDDSLTIAHMRLDNNKKCGDVKKSGGDASEPLGKKSRLEAVNNDPSPLKKLSTLGANGDETVSPPEIEEANQETNETGSNTGGKNMVLIPFVESNASDTPLGANGELAEIGVSPSETRQICDDAYGNSAAMIEDVSNEPECLLQGDGAVADENVRSNEILCIEVEMEDDVVDGIEEAALKAADNESSPREKLAFGGANGCETSKAHGSLGLSTSDESNIQIVVGDDGSQGQVYLLHERMRAQVAELDKKYDEYSEKFEKSYEEAKLMATSLAERIKKSQEDMAWLQERRAAKQRNIASAPLI